MNWLPLNSESQLEEIVQASNTPIVNALVIFKHSTRCSISAMALRRFEKAWGEENQKIPTYYLDLLNYRPLSTKIASIFNVEHQSPQVLVIKNGKCIYSASHIAIDVDEIKQLVNQ